MRALEPEVRIVAERSGAPARVRRTVTLLAVGREPGRRVVGSLRAIVISPMTDHAFAWRAGIASLHVARDALQRSMTAVETEVLIVVERRAMPIRIRRAM